MTAHSGCTSRWRFAAIALVVSGGVTVSGLWMRTDAPASRYTNSGVEAFDVASCEALGGASDKSMAVEAVRAPVPSTLSLKLPNAFAANLGQWDESIRFAGSTYGATVRFLDDGWSLAVRTGTDPATRRIAQVRFRHQGDAGSDLRPRGVDSLPGYYNYFLGNDPSQWRSRVPVFSSIEFSSESSELRVVVYDNGRELEYDLVVPDPALLGEFTVECDGISGLRLDTDGSLVLAVDDHLILRQQPPVAFLRKPDGATIELAAGYRLVGERSFGFVLDDDDIERGPGDVVVIDPVMTWATYYGGSGDEEGLAVATDGGLVTVAGVTDSSDLPMAGSSFQPSLAAQRDVFVGRFDPTQSGSAQLVWATFYGGAGLDGAVTTMGIAMSSGGDVAVVGYTDSSNLPIVGAHSQLTTFTGIGSHGFLAFIRGDGAACLYSSYLQVSQPTDIIGIAVHDVAIDSNNRIAVVGGAGEGVLAVNAYDSQYDGSSLPWHDAFLCVFDPSLSGNASLIYSSYVDGAGALGTPFKDEANAVEFDSGIVHVAGYAGNGFQLKNPLMPHSWSVNHSYGFIVALDISVAPTLQLAYATYFGATDSFTEINDIAVSGGVYYVTGRTAADNLPVSTTSSAFEAAAFQPTNPKQSLIVDEDAFVLKLNPQMTPQLRYCTYLGGIPRTRDSGIAIVRRAARSVVVVGWTGSSDFPISVGADNSTYSNGEGFLTCLNWGNQIPPSAQLLYSTFVGGSDNEAAWDLAADGPTYFVIGTTVSQDFQTATGSFQASAPAGSNAFVARFNLPASIP